jgi:1-acyl-sn-glycerol-3-phosphate acyltransferase
MAGASDERTYGKLYPVARAVLTPPFRFLWRIHVHGTENIPTDGPAIMCPNHTSVIDSFFLPVSLPRRITFVGKAEYLDDWKTKYLFPAIGMIPIDRGGGSASQRALDTAAGVLERGELFGIYPEGTRARDGKLHKGHTGPARLAMRTGAPIVPVGIKGTRDIQPPDAKFPKPFRSAEIHFGRPITMERYRDRGDDHLVLRQITDEVMFEIRQLTGQDYVDTYATKKADALPTEIAQVPSINGRGNGNGNGHDAADRPRRSSAEVLAAG